MILDMQHVLFHAHAAWTWTCSMSYSILHVYVHSVCPCPFRNSCSCWITMSVLHDDVHVACLCPNCPCCMSTSMLHVHVHAENVYGHGHKHRNVALAKGCGLEYTARVRRDVIGQALWEGAGCDNYSICAQSPGKILHISNFKLARLLVWPPAATYCLFFLAYQVKAS